MVHNPVRCRSCQDRSSDATRGSDAMYPGQSPLDQPSGRQDLNLRPLDPQSSALPSCATSRPRPRRARTQLSAATRASELGVLRPAPATPSESCRWQRTVAQYVGAPSDHLAAGVRRGVVIQGAQRSCARASATWPAGSTERPDDLRTVRRSGAAQRQPPAQLYERTAQDQAGRGDPARDEQRVGHGVGHGQIPPVTSAMIVEGWMRPKAARSRVVIVAGVISDQGSVLGRSRSRRRCSRRRSTSP